MRTWGLPSSSGRLRFSSRIIGRDNLNDGNIISEFWVESLFWPIRLADNFGDAESMVPEVSLRVHQIVFSKNEMISLADGINKWLDDYSYFSVVLGFSYDPAHTLMLSIGSDPGLIARRDKPACTMTYSGRDFRKAEWAFLVDESCLRFCVGGLVQILA